MKTALRGGRFVASAAIVIGLMGSIVVQPAQAAQTGDAQQVLSLVNSTRASVGLPALGVDSGLSSVAQVWAGVMALAGTIMHNPTLGELVPGWALLAENVGMGSSIAVVHQTLVASPVHFGNITDSRYTSAGAGVVAAGGNVFVVQIFMQGRAAAPPPPPPPPPAPEPVPAPEPEPEPARPAYRRLTPSPSLTRLRR